MRIHDYDIGSKGLHSYGYWDGVHDGDRGGFPAIEFRTRSKRLQWKDDAMVWQYYVGVDFLVLMR